MKKFIQFFPVMMVLSMLLAACNMGNLTPPPLEAAAIEPEATEPAAPALETVDLAGPPMEVGSKYVYVDGSVLAAVPGGPFIMGYSYTDNPEREVTVGDFWIYSSEVTNQQYALCVNSGRCSAPDEDDNPQYGNYRYINFPVTGVDHAGAIDYCTFVHGRLPSEAEWEKAARGPEGNIFPWGDKAPVCDLLNFNFCNGNPIDIQSYPKGVSYYGVFDMSGNIREWVADWYKNDYFKEEPDDDPLGPAIGEKRSIRSSSFSDSADAAIAAHRYSLAPSATLPDLGFRCVVDDPTFFAPQCEQLAYTGTGPDGSEADCVPAVQCNDVSITQGQNCTVGNVPFTIITFDLSDTPPTDWTYDATGCTFLGGDQYQCDPGQGPASVTGSCVDLNTCDPSCPAHYDQVGDTCVWDGSGTAGAECIPGMTYDPVNQCCSATPGAGVDFDLCPAGYYPVGGICVADPSGVVDSETQPVGFLTCNPNDGDDDGCNPDTDPNCDPDSCQPATCNYPYAQSPDNPCQCYCTIANGCGNYSP